MLSPEYLKDYLESYEELHNKSTNSTFLNAVLEANALIKAPDVILPQIENTTKINVGKKGRPIKVSKQKLNQNDIQRFKTLLLKTEAFTVLNFY